MLTRKFLGPVAILVSACFGFLFAQDAATLEKQSSSIVQKVAIATVLTSEAYGLIFEAVGNKEMASKLAEVTKQMKEVKKETDKEELKKQTDEINKAGIELEKVDFKSVTLSDSAKIQMRQSILFIGVATFFDGIAVKESTDLLKKSEETLKSLSGFSAMKQAPAVKRSIENCKWIADNAPPQLKQLTSTMGKLSDYAKANGIALPTQEEIENKSKDFEKE